jgi:hypothetical protein
MGLFGFGKKDKGNPPDFTMIDTMDKALESVATGELVPLYLTGLRFGGAADASNAVYTPAVAADLKNKFDDKVEDLLRQGKVKSFSAEPSYKGRSFVPSSITVKAGKDGQIVFEETIHIW